jgi:site-specific DNA-methyltransferase (adenine-specific)
LQLHVLPVEDINVPKNRQRKYFNETQIQELAASIAENGLISPLVVRREESGELILVAGERRLRALDICWGFGQEVVCNNHIVPERAVPCLYLGEIDEIAAFEIELEENIRRTDLDWKEKANAVGQLYELRRLQAERSGTPEPSVAAIAEEVSGTSEGQFQENIRQDLILARNMDNPVVAKAASRKEAFKALKRDEETKRNEELGRKIGAEFVASMHTLLQGDCLQIMPSLQEGSFDVILTDPPYGIGADEFGDSDGKTAGAHRYDDSGENFRRLLPRVFEQCYRLAKPAAHLYLFCDIDWFRWLKDQAGDVGWKCFRTPLIWVNPTAMRAPWPDQGPQRKWQMILYAVKGNKQVTRLYSDVLTYPSDDNLGHQAQKPVAVYQDLMRRSIKPGDSVLDPFCGSGTIFRAAHELKVRGTGLELDAAAVGIAAKRLSELK